jgi:hypothetical protein
MNKIKKATIIISAAVIPLLSTAAEMPKALKGTWILDAKATEAFIQTSPRWKPEDGKYLPMIMKRMSQVLYTFKDDSIIAAMRGKDQALPISSVKRDGNSYVFEGEARGKAVTLTIIPKKDGMINIRSSAHNDMDYYVWKRGTLPKEEGPSDSALVVDVIKESMKEPSNRMAGD